MKRCVRSVFRKHSGHRDQAASCVRQYARAAVCYVAPTDINGLGTDPTSLNKHLIRARTETSMRVVEEAFRRRWKSGLITCRSETITRHKR